MKPIVFVGPSLHSVSRARFDMLDFAAPAKCGDIYEAVVKGRRAIGLIDGVFEDGPAVWHKEILFALSQGVFICGASSMGALRAAECQTFGMIGIGRIFEDYKKGERNADADVALLHAPAELNYLPLTVPQVDVDFLLTRLEQTQELRPATRISLAKSSTSLHFKDRTWRSIAQNAGLAPADASLLIASIRSLGPGQKTLDAIELLDLLACGYPPQVSTVHSGYRETNFVAHLKLRKEIGHG